MKTKETTITIRPGTEFKLPNGRIVGAMLKSDGCCELTIKMISMCEVTKNDVFVLVEASELSLNDLFLRHEPQTKNQQNFKKNLTLAIMRGVKDFYRPMYDPSIDENGNIVFAPGKWPTVWHNYDWWEESANKYMSECKIRLGTKNEYVAFLGVLIKELVVCGLSIADAWYAVCDDSKKLGHYWNSENAKHVFEKTGSREVCGFFDLGNTRKILAWDDETSGYWLASGGEHDFSNSNPLSALIRINSKAGVHFNAVGWYVH